METGPSGPVSGAVNLFCSVMTKIQLKVVLSEKTALPRRGPPTGPTWRLRIRYQCAALRKTRYCRPSRACNGLPLSMTHPSRPALWSKSARLHRTISLPLTPPRSFYHFLQKRGASRLPGIAIRPARASAPMTRFGLSIIHAERLLTRSRPSPASKRGSRLSRFLCSIMLQRFTPWSRGCPRRPQNDAWPLTSSPDVVRFA